MANHVRVDRSEGVPFGATWRVTAPWAHPIWSDYVVFLADLTTPTNIPPVLYRPDVGYEVTLWAIDPKAEIHTESDNPDEWSWGGGILNPPNFGYQFPAESDDVAYERIAQIVLMINNRQLSPDTDHRKAWDRLFRADGMTLLQRGWVV